MSPLLGTPEEVSSIGKGGGAPWRPGASSQHHLGTPEEGMAGLVGVPEMSSLCRERHPPVNISLFVPLEWTPVQARPADWGGWFGHVARICGRELVLPAG